MGLLKWVSIITKFVVRRDLRKRFVELDDDVEYSGSIATVVGFIMLPRCHHGAGMLVPGHRWPSSYIMDIVDHHEGIVMLYNFLTNLLMR